MLNLFNQMEPVSEAVTFRLLYLIKNILPILVIAILGANILSEFGLVKKITFIVRPLIKFSHLPDKSGLTILTYLASPSAGVATLSGYYESKTIDSNETIITSILSNFFSFINHFFIYYIPIVLPIIGLTAGALYIGSRFFISLLVTSVAAITGHFVLNRDFKDFQKHEKKDFRKAKQKIKDGSKKSLNALKRILPRLFVIYTITAMAVAMGVFEKFKIPNLPFGLPGEVSTIVAVGFADTTSGIALAGSLLSEGILTPLEAVIGLLLASIISMSVIFLRHSLPGKIAYFGPKLGIKIAIITSVLDLIFTSIVVAILLIIYR